MIAALVRELYYCRPSYRNTEMHVLRLISLVSLCWTLQVLLLVQILSFSSIWIVKKV